MAPKDSGGEPTAPTASPVSGSGIPVSSFPIFAKPPTDRNVPFRNALDWLDGKRKDDNIEPHLWRVYDKLYDLNEFVDKHPGGSDWLNITRGMDITESFEVSHVVNVEYVDRTLAKYYIRDATHPRYSPYTFKEDGFFKVLKRRVQPILKEVGTSPSVQIRLIQDTMGVAFMLTAILGVIWGSIWLQILSGFILSITIIGSHNFFHLRDNWRKYYYDLSILSHHEWRVSHAISHHLFPNTVLDAEISMFEPLFMFLPTNAKSWFNRYGPLVYTNVILCIAFWLDFIKRWNAVLRGRQGFRKEFLIVAVELGICILLARNFTDGLKAWTLIHTASSYFFMVIAFQGGVHHPPDCFHDGDELRPGDQDFGLCQLDAIQERSDQWQKNLFVTLVTFGEHSLHHLFPTVCLSKLTYIKPIYLEALNEFNEVPPTLTQMEAIAGFYKQIQRTEPKPFKRGSKKQN